MTMVAERRGEYDVTDVPSIVEGAVKLGLLESVVVLLFSLGRGTSPGRLRRSCAASYSSPESRP